jgi:hypothetical protein
MSNEHVHPLFRCAIVAFAPPSGQDEMFDTLTSAEHKQATLNPFNKALDELVLAREEIIYAPRSAEYRIAVAIGILRHALAMEDK